MRVDVPGAAYGGVINNGAFDQAAVVLSAMFAHVRGLPMFTTLLGFGVGLIALSLARRGFPDPVARRILRRRYAWLAAFGAAHAVFLFFGDILIAYGVIALVLIWLTKRQDRTLLIIAGVLWSLMALGTLGAVLFTPTDSLNMNALSSLLPEFHAYWFYVVFNAGWALINVASLPITALTLLPAMIVGFVAARRGVHLNVDKYRTLLLTAVAVAAVVIVAIGLPLGLAQLGVLPDAWAGTLSTLNGSLGILTGPGIAALVLLLCEPLERRRRRAREAGQPEPNLAWPLRMVTALGKRSMSGYLFQSLVFVAICFPFTFNFGPQLGAFGQFCLIFGVWTVSLLLAWIMELRGITGPFEKLHRRLSYGRDGLPATWTGQEVADTVTSGSVSGTTTRE